MNTTIRTLAVVAVITVVTGCASAMTAPPDLRVVPNDCTNQYNLADYLNQLVERYRGNDEHVGQIKHRLWSLRYICNRV
jgi:hypothetical protein